MMPEKDEMDTVSLCFAYRFTVQREAIGATLSSLSLHILLLRGLRGLLAAFKQTGGRTLTFAGGRYYVESAGITLSFIGRLYCFNDPEGYILLPSSRQHNEPYLDADRPVKCCTEAFPLLVYQAGIFLFM